MSNIELEEGKCYIIDINRESTIFAKKIKVVGIYRKRTFLGWYIDMVAYHTIGNDKFILTEDVKDIVPIKEITD